MTVAKAAGCCTDRDVYYFDEEERYFLVSCLGLWHVTCNVLEILMSFVVCTGTQEKETTLLLRSMLTLHKVSLHVLQGCTANTTILY